MAFTVSFYGQVDLQVAILNLAVSVLFFVFLLFMFFLNQGPQSWSRYDPDGRIMRNAGATKIRQESEFEKTKRNGTLALKRS